MKSKLFVLLVLVAWSSGFCDDFTRNLPDKKMCSVLTPDNFKNQDAVIVLKEQSLSMYETDHYYRTIKLDGTSTTLTEVIIVKLFTERAVERYGTFEYSYNEEFGDEIPHSFGVKIRIKKESGKVWNMPDDYVKNTVSRETSSGIPITRKVLFKIPNLEAGDILQIESTMQKKFTKQYSGIFYFHAQDPILYSNVYITLPLQCDGKFFSFPQDKVGEPQSLSASNYKGAGNTLFWSMKNLVGIPNEPFSSPLQTKSYHTSFVVNKWSPFGKPFGNWKKKTKSFYKNYIDKDNVKSKYVQELGFSENMTADQVTYPLVDRLYKALRDKVKLADHNYIYPLSDDINEIFEKEKGDASDLAYAMYQILKTWGVKSKVVWLRDQREGKFETEVPTIRWFDRMAILVCIENFEKLYDFDHSIPHNYTMPWFDKNITAPVLDGDEYLITQITPPAQAQDNIIYEKHSISFDNSLKAYDEMSLLLTGYEAEHFRNQHHDSEPADIVTKYHDRFTQQNMSNIDSLYLCDFLNEQNVEINAWGISANQPVSIDSMLTIKLYNHFLSEMINTMSTPKRFNHIDFHSPFTIACEWKINLPDQYIPGIEYKDITIQGPNRAATIINFALKGNTLEMTWKMTLETYIYHRNDYDKVLKFFQDSLQSTNIDIILKHI